MSEKVNEMGVAAMGVNGPMPKGDEPISRPKGSKKIKGLPKGDEPLTKEDVAEALVRALVRKKISEVVRKKAGGGGFVLYAPNKGKKKNPKPVASFPTKLAAKRAELARFPPKDPKKLLRLRKEVEKLMKDPKKRAEAELRAQKQKGTDVGHHMGKKAHRQAVKGVRKEAIQHALESAAVSAIIIQELRALKLKENVVVDNHWDLFIKKIAEKVAGRPNLESRVDEMVGAMGPMQLKLVRRLMGTKYRKLI
jgi:hypothetical protein